MPGHVLTTAEPITAPADGQQAPVLPRRRLLAALAASGLLLAVPTVGDARERRRRRTAKRAPEPELALATQLADEIEILFWQMDGVRNLHGLPHLHRSPRLDQAAFAHAQDMARHNVLSHTGSDGLDAATRILRYYPFDTWIGENLALGYGSALAVLEGWRASAPHNANLLRPEFNAVGLACVARGNDPSGWFWAAEFGGLAD